MRQEETMKHLYFVLAVILLPPEFVHAEELPLGGDQPARCEIWGRIVAPPPALDGGLEIELIGTKSRSRQKTSVVNGGFEFHAAPAGLYQFRLVDHYGRVIATQAEQLTGNDDQVNVRVPYEVSDVHPANVV